MAFRTRQSNKLPRTGEPLQSTPPPEQQPTEPAPPPPEPTAADPEPALADPPPGQPAADAESSAPEAAATSETELASEAAEQPDAHRSVVQDLEQKWLQAQAHILDDPREAVGRTDQVVGEVVEHLNKVVTERREEINARWTKDDLTTDDLREVMKKYRDVFRHLVGAAELPADPEPASEQDGSSEPTEGDAVDAPPSASDSEVPAEDAAPAPQNGSLAPAPTS